MSDNRVARDFRFGFFSGVESCRSSKCWEILVGKLCVFKVPKADIPVYWEKGNSGFSPGLNCVDRQNVGQSRRYFPG